MATKPIKVSFASEAQKERNERYAYAMGFRSTADFLVFAAENYQTRNKLSQKKADLGDQVYEEVRAKKA